MRIHVNSCEFTQACSPMLVDDIEYRTLLSPKSTIFHAKDDLLQKKVEIGKFYFPRGKPRFAEAAFEDKIKKVFEKLGKKELNLTEMGPVAEACGYSLYWKSAIFNAARKNPQNYTVTQDDVINAWKRITSCCHDDSSRFVTMLAKPGNSFLEFNDFRVLLQDVVATHPGLAFLQHAPEFHSRYMNTVIARIFYSVNRSWSGRISIPELRRSNFLKVLSHLQGTDDINSETEFFSYEHFYVIYCKFWELDEDHDLVIKREQLLRHEGGVISAKIIERVLSGAVTRWDASDHFFQTMSYVDFVWFLLSEENKKTPTSIEYWFRCMDLDGDGRISMYEMEYFYAEQAKKLKLLNINPIPFENCLCQLLDLVKPASGSYVTLKDLKRCKMADVFFNLFINIEKYLVNEKKESSARLKNLALGRTMNDWERYAREEYDFLVEGDDDGDDADEC